MSLLQFLAYEIALCVCLLLTLAFWKAILTAKTRIQMQLLDYREAGQMTGADGKRVKVTWRIDALPPRDIMFRNLLRWGFNDWVRYVRRHAKRDPRSVGVQS